MPCWLLSHRRAGRARLCAYSIVRFYFFGRPEAKRTMDQDLGRSGFRSQWCLRSLRWGRSKRDAAAEAVGLCGAVGCKVDFTYYNQCAAVYVPKTGRGGASFGSSVTIEKAEEIASNRCATDGGIGCYKVYLACTEPEFIP